MQHCHYSIGNEAYFGTVVQQLETIIPKLMPTCRSMCLKDSVLRRAVTFSAEILKKTALRNAERPPNTPIATIKPAQGREFSSAVSTFAKSYRQHHTGFKLPQYSHLPKMIKRVFTMTQLTSNNSPNITV